MSIRVGFWLLASAVLIAGTAGGLAVPAASATKTAEPPVESTPSPVAAALARNTDALPPGHPPVNRHDTSAAPHDSGEPAAIVWTAPTAWVPATTTSSMRLATYRIPRAGRDTEDADLSVSRAGGSTAANVDRWIGQFDDAGKDTREERIVRGMKVTIVEVGGTYLGGMMTTGGASRHPDFRLLGAVLEGRDSSYFFKLTGPSATVRSARAAFLAMIEGIVPAK